MHGTCETLKVDGTRSVSQLRHLPSKRIIYLVLKPLSPDLVEMSDCSTPVTLAADGPLWSCWTKSFNASALPWASPCTCCK